MKINMKNIILNLVLLFLGLSAFSQYAVKNGLLWEISGKGLSQPSYLFGTYHFVGKNFLDTLPGVLNYLHKANTIVGEVIVEDEIVMAQKFMPIMILKDNSMDKILSQQEYAETDSLLKAKTPLSLSMLNGLKPSAVQITLSGFMLPKNISPENPALDIYFQKEAKNANKQVLGFETLEEQGALLFDSPLERQKELLLKTVRESGRMIAESTELFEVYKHQDFTALEKALSKSDDYTPEEMDALLTKRNKNWIEKMPGMMKAGPVFFAVGAGHLVGNEGLITLLRNLGYTVRPLSLK